MNYNGDLFLKAKKGCVEAYETLTEAYCKKIFGMALMVCACREEASELVQEVFITVYKSFELIQDERQLKTSIYKTAGKIFSGRINGKKVPDFGLSRGIAKRH